MSKSKGPRTPRPANGAGANGGSKPKRPAVPASADQRRKAAQRAVIDARRSGTSKLFFVLPAAVIAIIAILVVVYVAQGPKDSTGLERRPASDAIVAALNVPPAALDKAGVSQVKNGPSVVANPQPLLAADGTQRVLYVGAEYCPFCAGERWAFAVAMSRFGDFTGLQTSASSEEDAYPKTSTLSFYGSTFTSDLLTFSGYELNTNTLKNGQYEKLETLSTGDLALTQKFNAAPFVSNPGAIPFILIGGKYVFSGASFDIGVLQGLSHEKIASELSNTNSAVSKAVLSGANQITAAICDVLDDKAPAEVCGSPGVQAAIDQLASIRPVG